MFYAFGYLRVSTEEQTILNQRIAIKKWASDNDYEILEFFEDASISGKVAAINRPAFREMLEIVRNEQVDAVIVYELSRVGRTFGKHLMRSKPLNNTHHLSLVQRKRCFCKLPILVSENS